MQILLVEDDMMVSRLLVDRIKAWKQQIVLATSLEEARSKIKNSLFDIALLDMMLPDGFGYELISEMKQTIPRINIITMTGQNTPELEKTVRGLGITYYLSKPINFNELHSIINHIESKHIKEIA